MIDWPALRLASDYTAWCGVCNAQFSALSADDRSMIFGGNAARIYRLARSAGDGIEAVSRGQGSIPRGIRPPTAAYPAGGKPVGPALFSRFLALSRTMTQEIDMPRRGYADGPFGQIHFQALGDGVPLILLHQVPMTSGQFDRVYAPLARRGVRAIGIDMPGFGSSDPTAFVPRVEDYARAVVPVLETLGIARASILGHHTGALVATEVAIQFPDSVDRLILNGPLPLTEDERAHYFATGHQWELGFGPRKDGTHLTELFAIREGFAEGSVGPERISEYVVQAFSARGVFWWGHHAAFGYRHDDGMAKVTQPTLILTNTGDMIYAEAKRAHAMRPDFAFAELQGGGVDIVDQQPEAWAEIVAAFVRG